MRGLLLPLLALHLAHALLAPQPAAKVASAIEQKEHSCAGRSPLPGVKIFFINTEKAVARKNCIERQLGNMCLKGERFPAISFDKNPWELSMNPKYRDCFAGGVDHTKIWTHGTSDGSWSPANMWQKTGRILANWCSHYRLMERAQTDLELHDGTNSTYEHVLLLEDDVLLHQDEFAKSVKDFIDNYKDKKWDLVQLDAFGPNGLLEREDEVKDGYVSEAKLDSFRGKDIYMPKRGDGFWGFQAVLVKATSLPSILEKMRRMPVVPIDWLQKRINEDHHKNLTALTFQAGITRNPEQEKMKWGSQTMSFIKKPDYCEDEVMKSTIA